ncbi:MAG TPA: hypothetical protein VNS53_06370 [Sphingomicrobium sp.]|nr:hypothetical protein [Sphingomicrobium sp.]
MDPLMLALLVAGTDPPQSVAIPEPTKPAKVCREGDQVTGSHVRTGRRCLTQEQWDREDARRVERPVTMRVTEHQADGVEPTTRPQ